MNKLIIALATSFLLSLSTLAIAQDDSDLHDNMEEASIEVDHEMMEHEEYNPDPYENFNRKVFTFNNTLDKYALKPVAKAYDYVMPDVVNQGVTNVFSNIGELNTTVNSALQGDLKNSGLSVTRFLVNSTFGVVGIFDVASALDVHADEERSAQTLGVWGVKRGPYLMLPFLGSSTPRNAAGLVPDYFLNPVNYVKSSHIKDGTRIVRLIDVRADLLDSEKLIIGDRYTFIRDYYLNKVDQDTLGKGAMIPEHDDFIE